MALFPVKIKSIIRKSSLFLDGITDPMFVVDSELVIRYINSNTLSLMGYREDEVLDKMTCADLNRTPLCNTENCTIKNCIKTKKPIISQTIAKTRNGVAIPIRAACNAIYDKRGIPVGGMEIVSDIRALDEGFLENMADPAFRTDIDLTIQNINSAALNALGYSRDEVIGKMSCAEMCKTPLCGTNRCTIREAIKTKKSIVATTVAESRNGTKIPVRASCGALFDAAGNPTGGFEVISNIATIDEGFLNNMADPAFRTDIDLMIQNINDAALKALGYTREEVIGKMKCADLCKTPVCGTADCTIKKCIATRSTIIAETIATARDGRKIPLRAACGVLLDSGGSPCGGFEVISDTSAFVSMVDVARSLSEGDFTVAIDSEIVQRNDAVGLLGKALNAMQSDISTMIGGIIAASQNLAQAVEQISSGNENLSQRSTEQVSSLEEIASTIEEAAASIRQNASNSAESSRFSKESVRKGEASMKICNDAVQAINDISTASQKIGEIISVIDDITFQTNLLSLNAAVEAARAGDQGRGFAVVAGEVRNLAQRSASAAKEIGALIQDSMEKVKRGTDLVNQSNHALAEIVEGARKMESLVADISAASDEQHRGMEQINTAITELDTMTQQNASLVEEIAAASEEMANQAQELLDSVQRFKITEARATGVFGGQKEGISLPGKDTTHGKGNGKNLHRKTAEANPQKITALPMKDKLFRKQDDLRDTMDIEGFQEF